MPSILHQDELVWDAKIIDLFPSLGVTIAGIVEFANDELA